MSKLLSPLRSTAPRSTGPGSTALTVRRLAGASAALALVASIGLVPAVLAAPDTPSVEYVLTENNGNPEGVAWDPATQSFFTGTTSNGTIYRGTLGDTSVDVWLPGPGTPAIGMKAANGLLYVAGGPSGLIKVYSIASAELVASFETGSGGFLNDLVVTNQGIFVTDSLRPFLWRVTASQVAAGGGTPEAIPVGPEIPFGGGFALNGIVAFGDGSELIVVHSALGTLYRIDLAFERRAPGGAVTGRSITQLDAPTVNGDGLLLDRGMLVAVLGDAGQLAFLDLSADRSSASLLFTRTDATFQRPSTVARAHNWYLVVNADFTTSTPPFTLTGLSRQ